MTEVHTVVRLSTLVADLKTLCIGDPFQPIQKNGGKPPDHL